MKDDLANDSGTLDLSPADVIFYLTLFLRSHTSTTRSLPHPKKAEEIREQLRTLIIPMSMIGNARIYDLFSLKSLTTCATGIFIAAE